MDNPINNQETEKAVFPLFRPGFGVWEVVSILVSVMLLSIFLAFCLKPFFLIPKSMDAKKWLVVDGRLHSWKSRMKGSISSSSSLNTKHAQVITCSYSFKADGKKYPGSRVYIKKYSDDYDCSSSKEAKALMLEKR